MTKTIPDGYENFIPHLVCSPCGEAIEFYKKAFGAEEVMRMANPMDERLMHAEISIDGKIIFLNDDFPEYCGGKSQSPKSLGGTPVTIHRYVLDVDAVFQQAIDAGATALMAPEDMFWGDRYASVTDPFGHSWSFARHLKDMTPSEMAEAMKVAFSQMP